MFISNLVRTQLLCYEYTTGICLVFLLIILRLITAFILEKVSIDSLNFSCEKTV